MMSARAFYPQIVFILLLFSTLMPKAIACELDDAACGCEQDLLTAEQFAERTQYLWMDHPELFTAVKMRKYEGNWSFTQKKMVPAYLTETGIEKFKLKSPEIYAVMEELPYQSVTGYTYRYYYGPETIGTAKSFRGSGRDYLIQFGDLSLSKAERLVAHKGAGVNEKFGNGGFATDNFRTNGFLVLTDSFVENLTLEQYQAVEVPSVQPTDFILPREELQFTLKRKNGVIDISTVRTEGERKLLGGRQSHDQFKLTEKRKVAIVSSFLFWNLSHGSLNAENISGAGEILDPGHTGFSAPMVSGQYRCTTCVADAGDRSDGVMIGPLDYFFTPENGLKRSKSSVLSNSVVEQITRQMVNRISKNPVAKLELSAREIVLLSNLYREELPLHQYSRVHIDFTHASRQKRFYDTIDAEYFQSQAADSENYMANGALAARFMLQLAALCTLKGQAWFNVEIAPFLEMLPVKTHRAFMPLMEALAKNLAANLDLVKMEKTLFQEYRPPNVVREEFLTEVSGIKNFSELAPKLESAHDRLKQPMVFTPEEWWKKIKLIWKTLEPDAYEEAE